jgi:diguanylate cyclase (GGDEF)-like protein
MTIYTKQRLLYSLLTLLTLLFFALYWHFTLVVKTAEATLSVREIGKVERFAQALAMRVTHQWEENRAILFDDSSIERKKLEEEIALFSSDVYPFIYVLYRDHKGHFRFLLDGERQIENRSHLGDRLQVDTVLWERVYKEKRVIFQEQVEVKDIWITLLVPIMIDEQVEAVLAVDLSMVGYEQIFQDISVIETFLLWATLLGALSIAFTYFITYQLNKNRQTLYLDSLTTAFNRLYFKEIKSKIHLEKYQLGALDIDYFTKYNDIYGQHIGDRLLKEIVLLIKSYITSEDMVIRLGGTGFIVMVQTQDMNYFEKLRQFFEGHQFIIDEELIEATVSIGINDQPMLAKDLDDAVVIAEQALYKAKNDGRNCVVLYDHDNAKRDDAISLEDIKEAIEDKRVICEFQRIVPLGENQTHLKYETLVRIARKDGTLLYPNSFLNRIKNTKLYAQITKEVIAQAFELIEAKKAYVSVNFELHDFYNTTLMRWLEEQIKNHGAIAQYFIIEILENDEIEDFDKFQKEIKRFQSLGASIAIDDFGSGYANFVYLLKLGVDFIKIDGSLIREIDESSPAHAIVKSITSFAKEMNIQMIAEFVHNEEVLNVVKELEIEYAQGFHLFKPSILKELE